MSSVVAGIISQYSKEPEQKIGPVTAQHSAIKLLFDPVVQHLEEGGTAVAAVQLLFQNLESQASVSWFPLHVEYRDLLHRCNFEMMPENECI